MQGRSLLSALTDGAAVLRDAVLIENGGLRRSVRTPKALLTWHGPDMQGELYDLASDPDCFVNLWDTPEGAGLQSDMLHLLLRLMAENVDPLPAREGPW
jgi:hypothetical protein